LAKKLSELIAKDKRNRPLKVIIQGKPKSGKTTLISSFPRALLGDVEKSAERYGFPRLDWAGCDLFTILDQIKLLWSEPHEFKSFFVDSADWLEQIIWRQVLLDTFREQAKDKTIDDIGFAKGRVAAVRYWQQVLTALDYLHEKMDMHVGFVVHSQKKTVKDPLLPEYDRWEPKLDQRASGLLTEWAELIGFLTLDSEVSRIAGKDNVELTQKRVLHVIETGKYLAGNRFGLVDPIEDPSFQKIADLIK